MWKHVEDYDGQKCLVWRRLENKVPLIVKDSFSCRRTKYIIFIDIILLSLILWSRRPGQGKPKGTDSCTISISQPESQDSGYGGLSIWQGLARSCREVFSLQLSVLRDGGRRK
jgi:hypothetical protein